MAEDFIGSDKTEALGVTKKLTNGTSTVSGVGVIGMTSFEMMRPTINSSFFLWNYLQYTR